MTLNLNHSRRHGCLPQIQGVSARLVAAMVLSVAPVLSYAYEEGSCDDPVHRSVACGTFSILFENDLFADTDRHYTNGIKLSWMSRDLRQFRQWEHTPTWLRWLFESLDQFHAGRE